MALFRVKNRHLCVGCSFIYCTIPCAILRQSASLYEAELSFLASAAFVRYPISTSTAGCRGFTAIIVSWLSKFNAFAMVLVSFFLVFMQKGAGQIASQFNLNENASDVITGIILFFILGCEFFINFKVGIRSKRKEAGAKLS